jgi:hypothetical protein
MGKNYFLSTGLGLLMSLWPNYGCTSEITVEPRPEQTKIEVIKGKESQTYTLDKVVEQSELPHFLRNVNYAESKFDKLITAQRVYEDYKAKFLPINDNDKTTFMNDSITFKTNIYGKNIDIVLGMYTMQKDEKGNQYLLYHAPTGVERLDIKELGKIKNYLTKTVAKAAEMAYSKQKDWQKKIIEIQEAKLKSEGALKKEEKLEDKLDMKLPGYKNATYRDVMFVPNITGPENYVPETFIFAPFQALGICYLDIGVVGYNPVAAITDHILGKPAVLTHEFMHNNNQLQGLPYSQIYDVELFASFPVLKDEDFFFFTAHPYTEEIRKIAKVLFAFDSDRALYECVDATFGSTMTFNKAKTEKYIKDVELIADVIQTIGLEQFAPEFYAHMPYWTAVNDDLCDDAAAFKIYMYSMFEPTLLNGPAKTKQWCDENELVLNEIERKTDLSMKVKEEENDSRLSSKQIDKIRTIALEAAKKHGIDIKDDKIEHLLKLLDNLRKIEREGY